MTKNKKKESGKTDQKLEQIIDRTTAQNRLLKKLLDELNNEGSNIKTVKAKKNKNQN